MYYIILIISKGYSIYKQVYYTFLIIFKKPLILLNNYREYITQKKKKKFKKEKKIVYSNLKGLTQREKKEREKDKKKEREKKEKKILSLKYNTTATPLTAMKVKGESGEAIILFTHFRSF